VPPTIIALERARDLKKEVFGLICMWCAGRLTRSPLRHRALVNTAAAGGNASLLTAEE
jgi:delta 1-pyrroline-5-carboxylate dehydrogenase